VSENPNIAAQDGPQGAPEGTLAASGVAGPARVVDPVDEPTATDDDPNPDELVELDADGEAATGPGEDPNVAHGAP
jgi:hypothetical protein